MVLLKPPDIPWRPSRLLSINSWRYSLRVYIHTVRPYSKTLSLSFSFSETFLDETSDPHPQTKSWEEYQTTKDYHENGFLKNPRRFKVEFLYRNGQTTPTRYGIVCLFIPTHTSILRGQLLEITRLFCWQTENCTMRVKTKLVGKMVNHFWNRFR